jgi:hypothetical protein
MKPKNYLKKAAFDVDFYLFENITNVRMWIKIFQKNAGSGSATLLDGTTVHGFHFVCLAMHISALLNCFKMLGTRRKSIAIYV